VSSRPVTESQDANLVAALEAYSEGGNVRLQVLSADEMRLALRTTGRTWVGAGSLADQPRRKRVLALLALEAAITAPPAQWRSINELLEWSCAMLREDAPSEFERTWMLATIAFAQSERQSDFLVGQCLDFSSTCNHVGHALERFPEDPVFRAARIFSRIELTVLTRRPLGQPTNLVHAAPMVNNGYVIASTMNSADQRQLNETISKLRELTPDPVLGPKARLRTGIVHYEMNRLDDSRREIAEALRADLHPFDRYLAHLVLGLGFNVQKRPEDARREFAAAVAIDPGVISGAMELSAHQFAIGQRTEGSAVMGLALAAAPAHDDPWQRPCALCAGWMERLNILREGVKR